MGKSKKENYEEVGGPKDALPCFVASAPFFLLSSVLFYYVFTENYTFKWTLVLIFSGCAILMPGFALLMLGIGCITTGREGKLEEEQNWSHPLSLKRKSSAMAISLSTPPDLQWKTVPIQGNNGLDNDPTKDEKNTPADILNSSYDY